ncbi:MAG: P-loop NTPase [Candidatus Pacebacteria bacterium]|nr:P-loop NTPase [Candidatus Paceibacterota bacterium]
MAQPKQCDACTSQQGASRQTHHTTTAAQAAKQKVAARMRQIKHKIVVLSGKGGVGKSTIAANLAVLLAQQGKRVGLLDVDIHGPSIPRLLGLDGQRLTADNDALVPLSVNPNLHVVSIAFALEEHDTALIWRGPLKMGVIQQFLGDVTWGACDYLIVDSPPGTGDEPLSVCQLIDDIDGAVVVTTPQQLALADVRKSITFCRQVGLPIIGVIENMSGLICPHCGAAVDTVETGSGESMARDMGVPFLGRLPLDPQVMRVSDAGTPFALSYAESDIGKQFATIVERINDYCTSGGKRTMNENKQPEADTKSRRFALPLAHGILAQHFGHCSEFMFVDVDAEDTITNTTSMTPPEHEPGALPAWLREHNADVIIAGGMGSRAQNLLRESGITVIVGADGSAATPQELVMTYLNGKLETGSNVCDH